MPNDDQMKHPGEEEYYGQNPQIPNSQPLSGPNTYSVPKSDYPDPSIISSPLPPPSPVPRYMDPPSPTPQDLERGLQERIGTRNQPPKQQNLWKVATLALLIVVANASPVYLRRSQVRHNPTAGRRSTSIRQDAKEMCAKREVGSAEQDTTASTSFGNKSVSLAAATRSNPPPPVSHCASLSRYDSRFFSSRRVVFDCPVQELRKPRLDGLH
jgi:hypothetical protein